MLKRIDATKPVRDLFIDFIEAIIIGEYDIANILGELLEQSYNGLYNLKNVRNSYYTSEFEFGQFIVWEMCICSTAILLHHKCYAELYALLNKTYFLKANHYDDGKISFNFTHFRPSLSYIDTHINNTQLGDILSKRERCPALTTHSIANADVILYQLTDVFDIKNYFGYSWFPMLYKYLGNTRFGVVQEIWSKMVSKQHCESLFPLFNVTTIDELISVIKNNVDVKRKIKYPLSFDCATILNSISVEEIAKLP